MSKRKSSHLSIGDDQIPGKYGTDHLYVDHYKIQAGKIGTKQGADSLSMMLYFHLIPLLSLRCKGRHGIWSLAPL